LLGCEVDALDRDAAALRALSDVAGVRTRCADVEAGLWPYDDRAWDAIVVTNYLHRPLFPVLMRALAGDGVLIYETFMAGNERFGRPSTPDFLLRPHELLDAFGRQLAVVAFEQGEVARPRPAVVQRLCAVRVAEASRIRLPGCPAPAG
jgi:SAM-dependent methyltransferase